MHAAARSSTDIYLLAVGIAAAAKSRKDSIFKDGSGICVSAQSAQRFLRARTSIAGVRSPVQLIIRGALRNLSLNPKSRYSRTILSDAWFERITGAVVCDSHCARRTWSFQAKSSLEYFV